MTWLNFPLTLHGSTCGVCGWVRFPLRRANGLLVISSGNQNVSSSFHQMTMPALPLSHTLSLYWGRRANSIWVHHSVHFWTTIKNVISGQTTEAIILTQPPHVFLSPCDSGGRMLASYPTKITCLWARWWLEILTGKAQKPSWAWVLCAAKETVSLPSSWALHFLITLK